MIIGVGIDIIEVERVYEKILRRDAFKELVFSQAEIDFCESSSNPAENYAARFAAKEAFLKATGQGLLLGHELRDIEVVPDSLGKPQLKLHHDFGRIANEKGWNNFHVSLSHVKSMASAVVIIES